MIYMCNFGGPAFAKDLVKEVTPEEKIAQMKLPMNKPHTPVGTYLLAKRQGNLLYLAGVTGHRKVERLCGVS